MVDWTFEERKHIIETWGKINVKVVGPLALRRCLIVYPWTQRYFGTFGDVNSAAAIMGNKKVAKHGITVLNGLERAVQNMDDIKNTYAELSVLHSEKLHVDPDNFRLLGDCLTIVLASQMGRAFTPDIQAAWQKFLTVVVSALGRQYH
ncbi:hemoglobin subunit beta-like [Coregonus clupeaformis]|uniref:hemoglobin subunit beta-like n=1 Tax=Coregonus clupeaformis TaxID=59861 RepID=UPI001BE025DB|nr:hemoglobin subunit beta-like [Coregonus clupeaformis]